jgi:hypothetical protein
MPNAFHSINTNPNSGENYVPGHQWYVNPNCVCTGGRLALSRCLRISWDRTEWLTGIPGSVGANSQLPLANACLLLRASNSRRFS